MSIYKKLLNIQTGIERLKKDATSGKGNFAFNYASPSEVLNTIRPLMNAQGLLLKMELLSQEAKEITSTNKEGHEKTEILSIAQLKFTWIDAETGEKEECLFGANGCNGIDKGIGSAYTYGERYFLLKFFHIPTDGDDVDAQDHKELVRAETPQYNKQATETKNCSCGRKLYPNKRMNGIQLYKCYSCGMFKEENGQMIKMEQA